MLDPSPPYYRFTVRGEIVTAMDVIDAPELSLNFNLGCVVKYIVRHGRKPGAEASDDIRKALDCLKRECERMQDAK